MSLGDVDLICTDCDGCKRSLETPKKKSSFGVRAAKAVATGGMSMVVDAAKEGSAERLERLDSKVKEGQDCSICGHGKKAHSGKLTDPAWATPPEGGDFQLEPLHEVGIRGAVCLQVAKSTGQLQRHLIEEEPYSLVFLHDRLKVYELMGGQIAAEAPYSDLIALEVGGEKMTSGGGFIGGGFGLGGAALGMAGAAVLNKLTTRAGVLTLIRLEVQEDEATSAEWIFLTGVADPEAVDTALRPLTLHLKENVPRIAASSAKQTPPSDSGRDKVARLKELTELRDAGAIDEAEFALLKAEILST